MTRTYCRIILPLALVGASLTATIPLAGAAPASDPIAELRAREDELSAALAAVDTARLRQLWAEEFVTTMADGKVTTGARRLQALERQGRPAASAMTNRNDKIEVRLYGRIAVVLVTSSWLDAGNTVGSPYQATHVWQKRQGAWRLIAAHVGEVSD